LAFQTCTCESTRMRRDVGCAELVRGPGAANARPAARVLPRTERRDSSSDMCDLPDAAVARHAIGETSDHPAKITPATSAGGSTSKAGSRYCIDPPAMDILTP